MKIQDKQKNARKRIKEYKKAMADREILKRKLAQAKPELIEWIELRFGKVK